MREIIFDTETTGLSAQGGDRLVEIGCIELIDRRETGAVFHAYYNPERSMPPEAQAVHGLTDAFLADKPLFADGADALLEFLGNDGALVAHNATFDFGFVNAELGRLKRLPLDRTRMVDTVAIARRLHPGAKHSLDALCSRYGIDRSHRVRHGALLDAELLTQVYIELTGGRQIGLGLGTEPADVIPAPVVILRTGRAADAAALAANARLRGTASFRPARPHTPTVEEAARHAAFIAGIDGALWHRGR